ncbi:MAG: chemotaxis protein CheW [Acetobacteraceae bacterium]|nr:chemotaxis protein CheW [Acetobacteraceae bacterium]
MHDPLTNAQNQSSELLSFRLGAQEFCIDIMAVREIRGWTPATPLPHAPSYVRGVVNLRGAVLPIIDLAERMGLGHAEPTPQHVIIVAQVGAKSVGLLVSAVSDILTTTEEMIQSTPDVAAAQTRAFVQGLLTVEQRMLGVLRVDNLIPETTLEAA